MWVRLLIFCLLAPIAQADEGQSHQHFFNRITISASATDELTNDRMIVQLTARSENRSSATAANSVNKDMSWALSKLKQYPNIKSSTLNYRTFPKYREQKIVGWQVEQGLRLETEEPGLLAAVTGELQEKLKVRNMQYEASASKRKEKENRLITQAIDAFEERAKIVASSLQARHYRLVNMRIDTQNRQQVFPRMEAMVRSASNDARLPAVIQAGTQTVTVTVNGEIELVD